MRAKSAVLLAGAMLLIGGCSLIPKGYYRVVEPNSGQIYYTRNPGQASAYDRKRFFIDSDGDGQWVQNANVEKLQADEYYRMSTK